MKDSYDCLILQLKRKKKNEEFKLPAERYNLKNEQRFLTILREAITQGHTVRPDGKELKTNSVGLGSMDAQHLCWNPPLPDSTPPHMP